MPSTGSREATPRAATDPARIITMHEALSTCRRRCGYGASQAEIAFRSNNREIHAQICARGAGLAVLPRPLGDATPGIVPLDVGELPPGRDTFVGYHRDLRRLSRLRTLLELIIDRLAN